MQVVHQLCKRARAHGRLQAVLRAPNNNRCTALVTAGSFGHVEVLQALLQYYSYEEMVAVEMSSKDGE